MIKLDTDHNILMSKWRQLEVLFASFFIFRLRNFQLRCIHEGQNSAMRICSYLEVFAVNEFPRISNVKYSLNTSFTTTRRSMFINIAKFMIQTKERDRDGQLQSNKLALWPYSILHDFQIRAITIFDILLLFPFLFLFFPSSFTDYVVLLHY